MVKMFVRKTRNFDYVAHWCVSCMRFSVLSLEKQKLLRLAQILHPLDQILSLCMVEMA